MFTNIMVKKGIFKFLCLRQFALSIKMLAPFYWSQWMVLVLAQNLDVFMNVCGSWKLKPECEIRYKLLSFSGHWHNTRWGYFQRPCLGFILSVRTQSRCSVTLFNKKDIVQPNSITLTVWYESWFGVWVVLYVLLAPSQLCTVCSYTYVHI